MRAGSLVPSYIHLFCSLNVARLIKVKLISKFLINVQCLCPASIQRVPPKRQTKAAKHNSVLDGQLVHQVPLGVFDSFGQANKMRMIR